MDYLDYREIALYRILFGSLGIDVFHLSNEQRLVALAEWQAIIRNRKV